MTSLWKFVILIFIGLTANDVMAFSCSGPVGNIPVDVEMNKSPSEIVIVDMNKSGFMCSGRTSSGYQDAIRIISGTAILNSAMSNAGFTGFFIDSLNQKFDFSQSGSRCVWPDGACSIGPDSYSSPLPLKIGIRNNGANNRVTLPAGTEIARVEFQQRGNYSGNIMWGDKKFEFIFTLKNDLVIPAYTCSVDNGEVIKLNLPKVDGNAMLNKIGRYDGVSKTLDLNLTCEPQTSVDIKFDGETMNGRSDVLKNTGRSTQSVGIQIVRNGEAVVFGENKHIIDSAQSHETLSYNVYYYYNGGELIPGPVKSISTVTFDYR
ncbi:fimbrial protein [Enterobacter roggenkampii]|uniref:fimbrial protein n=1 Tax=Enterobacter roggenkampii TaxID=1812935 RepID=UPI002DBF0A0A|nr:fimbrial protein [Enterobacter roggenkampii]MEB6186382.1 fimbrial protein [Enterobacter roggenkampii]